MKQATSQLQTTSATLATLRNEIHTLTTSLPEHPIVIEMFGVGSSVIAVNVAAEGVCMTVNKPRGVAGF